MSKNQPLKFKFKFKLLTCSPTTTNTISLSFSLILLKSIASFPDFITLKGGRVLWGIALIAAAQSSCITTTYAGQFVMDGFLDINLPRWARAIVTRCVAVVPCVAVAVAFDAKAMELMIDIVNSSLAFLLPFALIPLTKLTTSKQYMGSKFVSGPIESALIWAGTFCCFGINFYTLVAPNGAYFGQYTTETPMTIIGVQMNIIQDLVAIFYIVACVYMALVKVKGEPIEIRENIYDDIDARLSPTALGDSSSSTIDRRFMEGNKV